LDNWRSVSLFGDTDWVDLRAANRVRAAGWPPLIIGARLGAATRPSVTRRDRSSTWRRAHSRRYGVWLAVRDDGSVRAGTVNRRAGPVVVRVRRPSPRGLGAAVVVVVVVAGPATERGWPG